MARSGRKRVAGIPTNAWQSTLNELDGSDPSQAGELTSGLEDGHGGGDKGLDADTGGGGYAGDAVESGHDAALAEPERPTDSEIHGDPRTHAGSAFPDEAKRSDEDQRSIGASEVVDEGRDED